MPVWRLLLLYGSVLALTVFAACSGGDDEAGGSTSASAADTPAAGSTPANTAGGDETPAATAPGTRGSGDSLDVCGLLTLDEVEAFLGVPPAEPQQEELAPPFFACSWESEQPVLNVSIIVWPDEDAAKDSVDLTAGNAVAEISGLGDEAHNTQPSDDVTFRRGRYEVTVGIYFLSDDDAEELTAAVGLAHLIEERLP